MTLQWKNPHISANMFFRNLSKEHDCYVHGFHQSYVRIGKPSVRIHKAIENCTNDATVHTATEHIKVCCLPAAPM